MGSTKTNGVNRAGSLTIDGFLEHAVQVHNNEDKYDSRKSSKDLRVRLTGDRGDEPEEQHEVIHHDGTGLTLLLGLGNFTDHEDKDRASAEPFKVASNINGNAAASEDGGSQAHSETSIGTHGNKVDTKENKGQLLFFDISGARVTQPSESATKGEGRSCDH